MEPKEFERKHKENKPVLAICYDFDKTLSPDDMQAQGYIQSVGKNVAEFWNQSNSLAEQNDMDQNLAYMFKMKDDAEGKIVFNKDMLNEYGNKITLYDGVSEWFERIRKYGAEFGVIVEHYIISSGLKEMIEGTKPARAGAFERIYASAFYYNERGVAVWPAQVVNYTNKTQFLFRIEKGVLDINDQGVNDYFAPEDIRVPFRNMIYIGDSDTDVPCMKLVDSNGGHAIGVYDPGTADKTKVYKMMRDKRIRYFVPSDYTDGSELDKLVKMIIHRTAANETLESVYYDKKKECVEASKNVSEKDKQKQNSMISLENSFNFSSTHMTIAELRQYIDSFDDDDIRRLLEIAMRNYQVRYVLNDYDVKSFYKSIIAKYDRTDEYVQAVLDEIAD